MAQYLTKQFSTYTMWNNVEMLRKQKQKVHDKTFPGLKSSLVSKAYAEGNCFARCGRDYSYTTSDHRPSVRYHDGTVVYDVSCQTVCYDPIQGYFERLYGFGDGAATSPPWLLSGEDISKSMFL
jgi:hypothetical protein